MRVEKMATKSDMFVKLVLVFFISLLSFAIGTFVGKKYSDNQHKLSQLEPGGKHGATREVASEHGDAHSEAASGEAAHGAEAGHDAKDEHATVKADKGVALTDAEIAKLAEEFVQDEEAPVATKKDSASDDHGAARATASVKDDNAKTEEKPDTKKDDAKKAVEKVKAMEKASNKTAHAGTSLEAKGHDAAPTSAHAPVAKAPTKKPSEKVSEIAEQVAKEQILTEKEVVTKKSATPPAALPKEVVHSSVGKFTVQIASHPAETDAKKLAEELKKKGFAAFYVPAVIKGQTYYRVSVGLFATQKEAQDYRAELVEKANVGSAFVQKIVQ